MRRINNKGRHEPRYEGQLAEVFEEIEFVPYRGNSGIDRRAGWAFLSDLGMNRGEYSGGWHAVRFNPIVGEIMGPSIFSTDPKTFHEEHSFELIKRHDGRVYLYINFTRISGAINLMEVTEVDVLRWLDCHKDGLKRPEETNG